MTTQSLTTIKDATPRFRHVGGDLYDACRPAHDRRITLAEAYSLISIWSRNALEWDDLGRPQIAAVFARASRDLCVAVACAEDWLSAGGDPEARLARLARP